MDVFHKTAGTHIRALPRCILLIKATPNSVLFQSIHISSRFETSETERSSGDCAIGSDLEEVSEWSQRSLSISLIL